MMPATIIGPVGAAEGSSLKAETPIIVIVQYYNKLLPCIVTIVSDCIPVVPRVCKPSPMV